MLIQHNEDYRKLRAVEYPSLTDQLDALWHAMEAGTIPKIEPIYTQIQLVKDKFPKPQSN